MYSDDIQNISIFKIDKEKIKWIKIGRYNKSMINNIVEDIYKLFPWYTMI